MNAAPNDLGFARLLHATDGSSAGLRAFAHALRVAVAGTGHLTVVSLPSTELGAERPMRPVRRTLVKWRLMPAGAGKEGVQALGVAVRKVRCKGGDPASDVLRQVRSAKPDLLFLAVRPESSLDRLLSPGLAGSVLRRAQRPTLLFPPGADGFVNPFDGTLALERVLVAVPSDPAEGIAAIRAAESLLVTTGSLDAGVRVVHVGREAPPAVADLANARGWTVHAASGSTVPALMGECARFRPDVLVMGTRGRDSLSDTLFGSTVERMVADARTVVLAVPVVV